MEHVARMSEQLRINEIEVIPIRATAGLVGFAGLTLNGTIRLNDIAIRTRPGGGFRLTFPTRKLANGTSIPIFYPISQEAGKLIEDTIGAEFERLVLSPVSTGAVREISENPRPHCQSA